ncbi:carbon-nitrogen hydrolase family protein [Larkinella bovis]|uniref:Carbon-nitrogen hydrolase family protein n=1 Tax=Larkinella bovis TaxID=683041 RepID=A0ABW0I899_9BACT
MKLCVAQTRPIKGDMARNRAKHTQCIELAVSQGADLIIFPELSITGYEPALAHELATTPDDRRFADFQTLSDAHAIIIGVGLPTPTEAGVCITMALFHPNQPWQTYSKQYLHADEEPFFVSGRNATLLVRNQPTIALAICYELSIAEHAQRAAEQGAEIYIASVAKTAQGVEKAFQRLVDIAGTYAMTVLMANSVGPSDDFVSGGKTAIWNPAGRLLAHLNDTDEGILVLNTDTQDVLAKTL